jgi:Putative Actinobacterial Holin-X, holin superfamily III
MPDLRRTAIPDLVAGVVDDARDLVEAQVSSLKADLGDRLVDLGDAIKSWLIAGCVALVTTILIGVALAATLTEVAGLPLFVSLWIVTAIAVGAVAALVYRARTRGRRAAQGASADLQQALDPSAPPPPALEGPALEGSV